MLRKCCTQYASKFGKLGSGHKDWKRPVFIPVPKKGNANECSNYHTIAFISHASKVMLKILQARLQQYMNCELPDVQAGFRKGRGTRDQTANIRWIIEKASEFNSFELSCWRRLLRVPWTARRSNQSTLKEISPEYSLEGLMLKLKLQYFGHLIGRADSFGKTLMLGKIEGRKRRG